MLQLKSLLHRSRAGLAGCIVVFGAGDKTLAAADEAVVLEVGSWAPYIDFGAPDRGVLSAQVQGAFLKSSISSTLREVSWKTAEERIDQAGALSYGWIRTEAREARWHYSQAICATRTVLVTRKDKPIAWTRLEQLKGIRLAWSRGYSYGNALDRLRPELTVSEMSDDVVALRRLLLGSVDAAPMDPLVARQLIQQRFSAEDARRLHIDLDPLRIIEKTELHVVCAKSTPTCGAMLAQFNRGLRQLRGDGATPACGD